MRFAITAWEVIAVVAHENSLELRRKYGPNMDVAVSSSFFMFPGQVESSAKFNP